MGRARQSDTREIKAIKVRQWLPEWTEVDFDDKDYRSRPDPHFYLFSLPASQLKALTGIRRRTTEGGLLRSQDPNIQRRHDRGRSEEIQRFVRYGYPWSTLGKAKRESGAFDDLRKPGWLPTAIIVNILRQGDARADQNVNREDFVAVEDEADGNTATVRLPEGFSGTYWRPAKWHPVEVIDGQHRLWAFEEGILNNDFELPVVAYHGLDVSWQAYLFWTINIKPKRINSSLAFDLYPLLRTEDWLERAEGLGVYRETRAQELTEALWSHPESPWHLWINMLGESGIQRMVSQAAWIRSLVATYVKSWEVRGPRGIGGLFGAPLGQEERVLPWNRAEQAAFLILAGRKLQEAIAGTEHYWAQVLRATPQEELIEDQKDPAFYGKQTLISTDQGIRGFLFVTNHLCYVKAEELNLPDWRADEETDGDAAAADKQAVSRALESLEQHPVASFLEDIGSSLAKYDWRTAAAPELSEDDRTRKRALRGTGGYRELRMQLFRLLAETQGKVGEAAREVLDRVR